MDGDADADADSFIGSSELRHGAASAQASAESPAGEQFRPYADQQGELGRIGEEEDAEAEALTPEDTQVQHCHVSVCLCAASTAGVTF